MNVVKKRSMLCGISVVPMKHNDKNTPFYIGLCNYIKSLGGQPKAGSHHFMLQREGLLGSFQYLQSKSIIREFKEEDTLFCSIPSSLPEHIRIAMKRMFIRGEFLQAAISGGKQISDFERVLDGVREEALLYSHHIIYRLLDYNSIEMSFLGQFGDGESRGCERLIKYHELLDREIQVIKILVEEFDKKVIALVPYCRTADEANFVKIAIRKAIPGVSIGLMVETFMCLDNLSEYMPVCSAFLGSSDLLADYENIARSDIDYSQCYEIDEMKSCVIKSLTNQLSKIHQSAHHIEICTCKDLNDLILYLPYNFSRTYTPDQLVLSDEDYMQKFGTNALG